MPFFPLPKIAHPDFCQLGKKPSGPVEIKSSHFNPFFVMYEGIDRKGATSITDSGSPSVGVLGGAGVGLKVPTTSYRTFAVNSNLSNSASFSVLLICKADSNTNNDVVYQLSSGASGINTGVVVWADNAAFNGPQTNCYSINIGNARVETSQDSFIVGKVQTLLINWRGGTDVEVWIDGKLDTTSFAAGTPTFGTVDDNIRLGGYAGSLSDYNGGVLFCASSQEGLSTGYASSLAKDPYQILKPAVDLYAFWAAGGGTTINAVLESLSLSTFNASVSVDTDIAALLESLTLTTNNATIQANIDTDINAALESIGVTTYQANLGLTVNASTEQISLSTFIASVSSGSTINANLESIELSAFQASISADNDINATQEQIDLSTYQASVSTGSVINAQYESIEISTNAATVYLDRVLSAASESIILTELAAQVSLDTLIDASLESLTVTSYGAVLTFDTGISATLESITLSTFTADITSPTSEITIAGLEYTIENNRLHFVMPVNKLHFKFEG